MGDGGDFGFGDESYYDGYRSQRVGVVRDGGPIHKSTWSSVASFAAPAKPQGLPNFKEGDSVNHSSFGLGVIKSITPAGSDALMEIEFADNVTKRLMLKSAMRYLEACKA
jgi:hypothetical protein